MSDQSFSVYFDLETTCGKSNFALDLNDESADMYVVSHCFIVTFHKTYSLNKITLLRSFNDTFVDLADLSCLSNETLELRDNVSTSQLYNYIQNMVSKKTHYALMEMFCCELKLVVDICKKWIYTKFTRDRLVLNFGTKKKFKEANPLEFNDLCCIRGFELSVTKMYGAKSQKMSYYDFVIKKNIICYETFLVMWS